MQGGRANQVHSDYYSEFANQVITRSAGVDCLLGITLRIKLLFG